MGGLKRGCLGELILNGLILDLAPIDTAASLGVGGNSDDTTIHPLQALLSRAILVYAAAPRDGWRSVLAGCRVGLEGEGPEKAGERNSGGRAAVLHVTFCRFLLLA